MPCSSLARWPPKFAYHVWLWTTSAPSAPGRHRQVDRHRAQRGAGAAPWPSSASHARWARPAASPPSSRSAPQQCTVDVDEPRELAREVLDVHAGAAVDLRRVLAGQQRDPHHASTVCALGDDDDAAVGDREALAVGLGVDADLRAPARRARSCRGSRRRTTAPRPTSTPCSSDRVLDLACECTCTPGETTERADRAAGDDDARRRPSSRPRGPCGRRRRRRTSPAAAGRARSGSATRCCRG